MKDKYKQICDRLYTWLNDMRFGIAPDESVTDDNDRHDRLIQMDLLDEIMEWMVEQEAKEWTQSYRRNKMSNLFTKEGDKE